MSKNQVQLALVEQQRVKKTPPRSSPFSLSESCITRENETITRKTTT